MDGDAEARRQLNMSVLRRHDPAIDEILESASFVVLYSHDGNQWTKMGVEGPMFVFKRSRAPHHGFFILNRNGIENYSAHLRSDDDIEVTPEYIIYQNGETEEVVGIWVFEPSQRKSIGKRMEDLLKNPPAPKPTSLPAPKSFPSPGQSISLATLFGGDPAPADVSSRTPVPPSSTMPPKSEAQTGQANGQAPLSGAALLDSLFKNASLANGTSQTGQSPQIQRAVTPSQPPFNASPAGSRDELMAMLGLPSGPPPPGSSGLFRLPIPANTSFPPPHALPPPGPPLIPAPAPSRTHEQAHTTQTSGLDALFASATTAAIEAKGRGATRQVSNAAVGGVGHSRTQLGPSRAGPHANGPAAQMLPTPSSQNVTSGSSSSSIVGEPAHGAAKRSRSRGTRGNKKEKEERWPGGVDDLGANSAASSTAAPDTPKTKVKQSSDVPLNPGLAVDVLNGQLAAEMAKGRRELDNNNGNGKGEEWKSAENEVVVLGRRDFVREVLSLIHTDDAFVDALYGRYLSRMGAESDGVQG